MGMAFGLVEELSTKAIQHFWIFSGIDPSDSMPECLKTWPYEPCKLCLGNKKILQCLESNEAEHTLELNLALEGKEHVTRITQECATTLCALSVLFSSYMTNNPFQ